MIIIGSQTIGGSGGLPAASGSGQTLISSGAGSTYTARALTASDVSGVGVTQGTYAAMLAATPAIGDRWLVTSGSRRGSYYQCLYAGVWSYVGVNYGVEAVLMLDAESLSAQANKRLRMWQSLKGDSPRIVSGQAVPWVVAASLGGLPAAAFGTTVTGSATTILRADDPGLALGANHAVMLAVSSVASSGNNGVVAFGPSGSTTASLGIYANFTGSGYTGPCAEYDAAGTGFHNGGTALGAGSGIKTLGFAWSNGTGYLYVNGARASTFSSAPGSTRGVLAADSVFTLGVGRTSLAGPLDGLVHAVIVTATTNPDADFATFQSICAERFAP